MTRRERLLAILAFLRRADTIAAIVLLALSAIVLNVEQTKPPGPVLDSYSSYDAKTGGYRAWYQLLKAEGRATGTFERHHAELDRGIATLVYAEPLDDDPRAVALSAADIADLQAWVRDGGDLVYLGHDDVASRAGILALPGTVPRRAPRKGTGRQAAQSAPAPSRGLRRLIDRLATPDESEAGAKRFRVACACVVGTLAIAPDLRALGIAKLDPRTPFRLYAPPGKRERTLFADARGALAVSYAFGRGRVTVLPDETLLSNGRIATGDHARLAVALAGPGPVAFDELVHGYFVPQQWYEVVPRPFAIAIGIAIVAVLIAIGGASFRLGPPVVPFEREPTSVEFIDSLAGLFERNHATRAALADAVTSVRRTVATSLGLLATAPLETVATRVRSPRDRDDLSELSGLLALAKIDDATLTRGLALAQRLRKDYAHGRQRN